jgi:hypothetical protein
MNTTTTTSRLASFSAAVTVTLALLAGVFSMAVTPPVPNSMATAPVVKAA